MLVDDTHAVMDFREYLKLPEYSASLPTGTMLGKRWRRKMLGVANWWLGEYSGIGPNPRGPHLPDVVFIKWRRILIVGSIER